MEESTGQETVSTESSFCKDTGIHRSSTHYYITSMSGFPARHKPIQARSTLHFGHKGEVFRKNPQEPTLPQNALPTSLQVLIAIFLLPMLVEHEKLLKKTYKVFKCSE